MNKLIKQALGFFGISGIGWIMDMTVFLILTSINVPTVVANIASSGIAVTFVYYTSTRKMFVNKNETLDLKKKYIFYILYQIIMIMLSSYIIFLISKQMGTFTINIIVKFKKIIAKIIVTPFTMIINFIFMKFLIEKI